MLLALLLSLPGSLQADDLIERRYEVGSSPTDLDVRDMNGDGLLDIVTASHLGDSVSVLFQVSGRTFAPAVSTNVAPRPDLLTTGAFGSDPVPDVAVAFNGVDQLRVFQGNGLGGISELQSFDLPGNVEDLMSADLNNDGLLDLALSIFEPQYLMVFDGLSDGTFAEPTIYFPTGAPTKIDVGDMNGDGLNDVVVATCTDIHQNVFEGTPQGNLVLGSLIDTADEQFWNELADIDNDGDLDLLSMWSAVEVWIQQDYPDFTFLNINSQHTEVVAGDLTGDGWLDVASGVGLSFSPEDGYIRYSQGDGNGSFTNHVVLNACVNGEDAPRIADLDGDGRQDLITYCSDLSRVTVWFFIPEGQPAVDKLTPGELPTLLGEGTALRVNGLHFDQLTSARLGSAALALHFGSGPDDLENTALVLSPTEIRLVPAAQAALPDSVLLTLQTPQGSTAYPVTVTTPVETVLQTFDADQTYTAGAEAIELHLGALPGSVVGLASSPDLIPTPLPGLVDLAIGNGGATLTTLAWLLVGGDGWSALSFPTQLDFAGLVVHVQSVAIDVSNPLLPIVASEPLTILLQ